MPHKTIHNITPKKAWFDVKIDVSFFRVSITKAWEFILEEEPIFDLHYLLLGLRKYQPYKFNIIHVP